MYWLVWGIFLIIFTFLGQKRGPLSQKSYVSIASQILLILTLSILAGLGGVESTDHYEYEMKYRAIQDMSIQTLLTPNSFDVLKNESLYWEYGFSLYCKLCSSIGLSYVGFFLLTAVITNTLIIKTLYRFKYPVFCMLLFMLSHLYFQESNIVRQTFAISFFAYSLKYIEEGKAIKYILFVLFASSMHSALFLCILLYPLRHVTTVKSCKISYILLLFLWLFSIYIAFSASIFDFGIIMENTYQYQSLWEKSEDEFGSKGIDTINNAIIVLIFFNGFFQRKRIEIYFNVYLILTVLYVILCNFSVNIFYFYRVSLIFEIVFCFYLGTALQQMKFLKLDKYTIPFILIALFKIYSFLIFVYNGGHGSVGKTFYSIEDIFI